MIGFILVVAVVEELEVIWFQNTKRESYMVVFESLRVHRSSFIVDVDDLQFLETQKTGVNAPRSTETGIEIGNEARSGVRSSEYRL